RDRNVTGVQTCALPILQVLMGQLASGCSFAAPALPRKRLLRVADRKLGATCPRGFRAPAACCAARRLLPPRGGAAASRPLRAGADRKSVVWERVWIDEW